MSYYYFSIYTIIEPSNDKSNNAITIAVVFAVILSLLIVITLIGLTGKINYELVILLLPLSDNDYQEAKKTS